MEITNWNTSDGKNIHGQNWEIENEKGVIGLIHGLGEHVQRYDHVAKYFNKSGWSFCGFDLRGHGKSGGIKGHTPDYEQLMKDVDLFLSNLKSKNPDRKIVLYGHSMGGNITLNYILRRNPGIQAGIISSPWLENAFNPPVVKETLGKMMNKIWPSLTLGTGLDTNQISRIPEVVKEYESDPLVHDKISSRLYNSVLEAGQWAMKNGSKCQIPLFLFHGQKDGLTSWKALERFSKTLKPSHHLHLEPEGFHELHNDIGKEKILTLISDWLSKTIVEQA